MNKKRIIGIALLLLLFVAGGIAGYAWWNAGVNGNNDDADGSINISEANGVDTTVSVADQSGANLVPIGAPAFGTTNAGDVEYVDLVFTVNWTADNTTAAGAVAGHVGTLNVVISELEITNAHADRDPSGLTGLLRFEVGTTLGTFDAETVGAQNLTHNAAATMALGTPLEITIRVMIASPANATEGTALQGANITFNVNFAVVAA